MDELISRRVSYGIELIDVLTNGAPVGAASVSFGFTGVTVPGPEPTVYQVGRGRWVFEDLQADVRFTIDSEFYHSQTIDVAAADLDGSIHRMVLKPRTGYPFPSALTRVIGIARLSSGQLVSGAAITVVPWHFVPTTSSYVAGTAISTQTTEDGQYVVWFEPDPGLSSSAAQATATRFDASAAVTLIIGGVPENFAGDIANQAIVRNSLNSADVIEMT